MVFIGRVVENKNFGKTGFIEVLLPQEVEEAGGERMLCKDLREDDTKQRIKGALGIIETNTIIQSMKMTKQCMIISPMGNGYNTGMLAIPQINTIGLVMKIDNPERWSNARYVWLGGLFGSRLYGQDVALPYDDSNSELLKHEDEALKTEIDTDTGEIIDDKITRSDLIKKGEFIIKTKSSRFKDYNSVTSDDVDFEKIPTESQFVMSKEKINLRHNEYDENDNRINISDLKLDEPHVALKRLTRADGDDEQREEQIIEFNKDKSYFQFLNKETGMNRHITMDNDRMTIEFDNMQDSSNIVTLIFDKDGKINLHCTADVDVHVEGNSTIQVDKDADILVKGNAQTSIEGYFRAETGTDADITIGSNLTLHANGVVDITSGAGINMDAPVINLNSGSANQNPAQVGDIEYKPPEETEEGLPESGETDEINDATEDMGDIGGEIGSQAEAMEKATEGTDEAMDKLADVSEEMDNAISDNDIKEIDELLADMEAANPPSEETEKINNSTSELEDTSSKLSSSSESLGKTEEDISKNIENLDEGSKEMDNAISDDDIKEIDEALEELENSSIEIPAEETEALNNSTNEINELNSKLSSSSESLDKTESELDKNIENLDEGSKEMDNAISDDDIKEIDELLTADSLVNEEIMNKSFSNFKEIVDNVEGTRYALDLVNLEAFGENFKDSGCYWSDSEIESALNSCYLVEISKANKITLSLDYDQFISDMKGNFKFVYGGDRVYLGTLEEIAESVASGKIKISSF